MGVLQQGGQRVGDPRQQQLGSRGNNGRVLVGDRVDGTWEVRVTIQPPTESVDGRSRGSASAREHNISQQSWSVCKSATPRKTSRPVHVVHRHHHHHYHHHYFPGEGDSYQIPQSAFVSQNGEEDVANAQHGGGMPSGRFAPSSSPSASPPSAAQDSSEHRHFHYHHHAQSIGIPGHAQKLLQASDQKQSEAEAARGASPIPLSRTGGIDVEGNQ